MEGVGDSEFFSVNRFLFDALHPRDPFYKVTQKSVAQELEMDSQTLRRHLINLKLPTQMKRLKNRARAIVDQLQDPPLCYKAY